MKEIPQRVTECCFEGLTSSRATPTGRLNRVVGVRCDVMCCY